MKKHTIRFDLRYRQSHMIGIGSVAICNLFIWAYSPYTDELGSLGIIFYDQRKRHFGGKGITGGYIQLLSPTKIRWKLDEEKGIWNETEGDDSISDAERRPIGFSVPDDVIMTKE